MEQRPAYPCQVCGLLLESAEQLRLHQNSHREVFSCPPCKMKFATAFHLELHEKYQCPGSKKEKYKCDECQKSLSCKSSLERHKDVVHKGIKNHVCPHCQHRLASNSGLKRHIRQHHPFLCSTCGESFKTKAKRDHHVKIHARFTCSLCPENCSTLVQLQDHMKIHNVQKPSACSERGGGSVQGNRGAESDRRPVTGPPERAYSCSNPGKNDTDSSFEDLSVRKSKRLRLQNAKVSRDHSKDFSQHTNNTPSSHATDAEKGARVKEILPPSLENRVGIDAGVNSSSGNMATPVPSSPDKNKDAALVAPPTETERAGGENDPLGGLGIGGVADPVTVAGSSVSTERASDDLGASADDLQLYQCFFCIHLFDSRESLYEHQDMHIASQDFECPYCLKSFDCLQDFIKHQKICENSDDEFDVSSESDSSDHGQDQDQESVFDQEHNPTTKMQEGNLDESCNRSIVKPKSNRPIAWSDNEDCASDRFALSETSDSVDQRNLEEVQGTRRGENEAGAISRPFSHGSETMMRQENDEAEVDQCPGDIKPLVKLMRPFMRQKVQNIGLTTSQLSTNKPSASSVIHPSKPAPPPRSQYLDFDASEGDSSTIQITQVYSLADQDQGLVNEEEEVRRTSSLPANILDSSASDHLNSASNQTSGIRLSDHNYAGGCGSAQRTHNYCARTSPKSVKGRPGRQYPVLTQHISRPVSTSTSGTPSASSGNPLQVGSGSSSASDVRPSAHASVRPLPNVQVRWSSFQSTEDIGDPPPKLSPNRLNTANSQKLLVVKKNGRYRIIEREESLEKMDEKK